LVCGKGGGRGEGMAVGVGGEEAQLERKETREEVRVGEVELAW